jgi:FkbM family methyltransferase
MKELRMQMKISTKLRTNTFARSFRDLTLRARESRQTLHHNLSGLISEFKIVSVVDVGANVGQFGIDLRRYGFKGEIYSFEPVVNIFNDLVSTSLRKGPWTPINLALGSHPGDKVINVSGNSGLSSSFLEMKSLHQENFPSSIYVSSQLAEVSTVDIQVELLKLEASKSILKLDVQGFELEVLNGATQSLSDFAICLIEVSLSPLYQGEGSLLDILHILESNGHDVIDVFSGIRSNNGKLLQIDLVTLNRNQIFTK